MVPASPCWCGHSQNIVTTTAVMIDVSVSSTGMIDEPIGQKSHAPAAFNRPKRPFKQLKAPEWNLEGSTENTDITNVSKSNIHRVNRQNQSRPGAALEFIHTQRGKIGDYSNFFRIDHAIASESGEVFSELGGNICTETEWLSRYSVSNNNGLSAMRFVCKTRPVWMRETTKWLRLGAPKIILG